MTNDTVLMHIQFKGKDYVTALIKDALRVVAGDDKEPTQQELYELQCYLESEGFYADYFKTLRKKNNE